ncbi:hypothetical protein [Amycolatopsis thermophila]|uniref:Uncharacterized protein n=1 Tax=Amycolatopsis thermophila TaxID=206084 RepID=A0ABU0EMR3_9PSEU|nr:hypothetical protein [Amycolatopsis thermophila]MDQ0376557.1 hypothetical protein [Amycolatopsis thermophila]
MGDDQGRAERARIAELADQWRKISGRLPFLVVEHTDRGDIVLREQFADGEPVATLHGRWAPEIARYLDRLQKDAGVALAELLWVIGGHGDGRDIRRAALNLLRAMGLEQRKARHRPR